MDQSGKLFVFKLAKQEAATKDQQRQQYGKWQTRDGVSIAGCSLADKYDNYRDWHYFYGGDRGIYC